MFSENGSNLRGTQLLNFLGNSAIKSSLILSFKGPKIKTGLVYFTKKIQNIYTTHTK